jgi:hypothetical protein
VVTLSAADITGAGGALLAGPTFTGVPNAPTAAQTVNNTQLATTAFVTTKVAGYLPLAGGTLTGPVTINNPNVNAALTINTGNLVVSAANANFSLRKTVSGNTNAIYGATGTSARWSMLLGDATAEAAGNVGSEFAIWRYSNTGTALDSPLTIYREDGSSWFANGQVGVGGGAVLYLDQPTAAASMAINGMTAGSGRWSVILGDGTAESGGNAGTNFIIQRLSDTSTYLGNSITIARATGVATFEQPIVNGSSDRTLKKNIAPIVAALDKVMKLQGVSFDWIVSGERRLGMIAQDVAPIVPEAIQHFDHNGEQKLALDYPQFIGLLVEAVKTLAARVTSLENIRSRA